MTTPPVRIARRRPSAEAAVLPTAPAPAPERWLPSLLDSLSAVAGTPVQVSGTVEPLGFYEGPWSFSVPVTAAGSPDPVPFGGQLQVRVVPDRAQAEREAAAMTIAAGGQLSAPPRLPVLDLEDPGGEAVAALVWPVRPLASVPDLIGLALLQSEQILAGFGAAHAALHDSSVTALNGEPAPIPHLDREAELSRIDGTRYQDQLARLRELQPPPGPAVLCHGAYQPYSVYAPGPAEWDSAGGPGQGLEARNWCHAILTDREFDVGYTLIAFWMTPYFAPTRADRTSLRMVRGLLSTGYRSAYEGVTRLDPDRLRYWQAFHALRTIARLQGGYLGENSPFAFGDRSPLPADLVPELSRFLRGQRPAGS